MNYPLNPLSYTLPPDVESALAETLKDWKTNDKIFRLWSKDASLWTNSGEEKWLGWLDIVDEELAGLDKYADFAQDSKSFEHIALLGMGGSSLCPEVLSLVFGKPQFHILDSTVTAQVRAVENSIDLAKTLFIVASKSGSTLEPNCFKQYFYERVTQTLGAEKAGAHFVAITDPGSKMRQVAERDNFRKIFFGKPEIGGRFSALSVFGMAAAAAMQIDVKEFLSRANEMVHACKSRESTENPGVILGAILGAGYKLGRDKLKIIASPSKRSVGSWLEQLIAESLGKNGVSIIPIDRKGSIESVICGDDSVFVYLRSEADFDPDQDALIAQLDSEGQAVIRIRSLDKANLGQEFFRWEFATAVAGAIMGLNPFDQPDVEAAKIEARKITEEFETTGALPAETPFFEQDGIKLFTDEANQIELKSLLNGDESVAAYVNAHLGRIKPKDYFAILAYLEMNFDNDVALEKLRHAILQKYQVATSLQFGPRFLHSTGQAFKGGAGNGVFLQITSDDAEDFTVPGQKYSFGVVKAAQSRGDFQVLLDRKRRALRIHLPVNVTNYLQKFPAMISGL
jgi:glucose-6-phosphate isomerase